MILAIGQQFWFNFRQQRIKNWVSRVFGEQVCALCLVFPRRVSHTHFLCAFYQQQVRKCGCAY